MILTKAIKKQVKFLSWSIHWRVICHLLNTSMKILTLNIILFLFAAQLNAQIDSSAVTVHKDPRIDLLIKKQIEYNEVATRDARRFVQGYRILVMSTNDRNRALNAKTKIYQEFPDLKAYLNYQAPFFKLKVGNFKEHKDAEDFLPEIQKLFPSGVYIVRDVIEVNPDKSEVEN